MGCPSCGAENRPGARFCNGCGAALAARCASCGQGNPPGARVWAAWTEADLGAFDEARRLCAEAVRIAEDGDHAFSITLAYLGTGYAALRRGDCERAIPALERSFDLCRAGHAPNFRSAIVACLGAGYGLAGRAADARSVLAGWEAPALMADLALWVCLVGEATLLSGGAQAALPFAVHGLELARSRGERRAEAWALRLLGEVSIDRPDGELAEGYYREALVLAEELQLRPLQAHCRLGLGVLYRRAGRLEDARAHLSSALDLLHDMRMLCWLPQAEAELTQAGGPITGTTLADHRRDH